MPSLEYSIRPENIACEPREMRLGSRDLGRMLVIHRKDAILQDQFVRDLPELLMPGDVFIVNDSKRMPGGVWARTRKQDAQIELRFTHLETPARAVARIYPTHFIHQGAELVFPDMSIAIVKAEGLTRSDLYRIELVSGTFTEVLKDSGFPITSFFYHGRWKNEHYNTFYAREEGSFESPMAGLHLTPQLISRLESRGVEVHSVTLHVVGSWLPTDSGIENLKPESYVIPAETAQAIRNAKGAGKRVIACGSTSVKTLESCMNAQGEIVAGSGESSLHISPGFQFRAVDGYFTNFHPSKSSLMELDSSFCDPALLLKAYKTAQESGYLFLEFGDAVLYL